MKSYLYYLPTIVIIFISAVFMLTSPAFAFETPSYPSCLAPQGTVIAHYDTGIHGIVGDETTHTGSDTVYQLGDGTYLQCFCDENMNGIQTNWMKVQEISDEEIAALHLDGWIDVPNGADWGLDEGPFLAKNLPFDCNDCLTPTPTPTLTITPTEVATPSATPTLTPELTPTPQAGSSGQVQSYAAESPKAEVLAATTITTLAGTGSMPQILSSLVLGILSMSGGLLLKKSDK